MAETTFVTSQYVSLHQQAAILPMRLLAWVVDGIVMFISILMVAGLAGTMMWSNHTLGIIVGVSLIICILLYPLLMERYCHGQSLGKMVCRIQVVALDGSRPSLSQLLLRWLLLIVDGPMMGSIGMLSIIFTKNSQRLGDLAAGTTVIQKNGYAQLHINLSDFQYALPDYQPTYPEAALLSQGQSELLQRVLFSPISISRGHNLYLLSKKVQQTFGITTQQSPERFLYTIYNDHLFFRGE